MPALSRPLPANLIPNPIITPDIIPIRIPIHTSSEGITVFTTPIAAIGGSFWPLLLCAHFNSEVSEKNRQVGLQNFTQESSPVFEGKCRLSPAKEAFSFVDP